MLLQLLHLIGERHNLCKHIHLPAQSGNTEVLQRMRRGYVIFLHSPINILLVVLNAMGRLCSGWLLKGFDSFILHTLSCPGLALVVVGSRTAREEELWV